jgi:hypothetical protein
VVIVYGKVIDDDREGDYKLTINKTQIHNFMTDKKQDMIVAKVNVNGATLIFHSEDQIDDLIKLLSRNRHKIIY